MYRRKKEGREEGEMVSEEEGRERRKGGQSCVNALLAPDPKTIFDRC